jgi:hypothetical protein
VELVKKELKELITEYILDTHKLYDKHDDYTRAQEALDSATIEQLWRLYRSFVLRKAQFKLLFCISDDLMGLNIGTMFVGIETDGYAHS